MVGKVVRVNLKPKVEGEHGLPKHPVETAWLGRDGLTGDFNRFRHEERHDDPEMAVLLLPLETIDQLRDEGWPVRPGDLGENLTVQGLPANAWGAGRRFEVGSAILEVTKPCTPCDNLLLLPYVGQERGAEFLRTMLDRRGWYARVVREGSVRAGDPIAAMPSPGLPAAMAHDPA